MMARRLLALLQVNVATALLAVRCGHIVAREIPYDVAFLRGCKAALRKSLAVDSGLLSEDALAAVEALAAVNPSLPDPSSDADLWSGEFELLTNTFSAAAHGVEQLARPAVQIAEDGSVTLSATIGQSSGDGTPLSISGSLRATEDAMLALSCTAQLAPTASGEIRAACAAASGLAFGSSEQAADPSAELALRILYLDQDLHILELGGDELDARAPNIVVLSREGSSA